MGDYWTQRSAYTVPPSHWNGRFPGQQIAVPPGVVHPAQVANSCAYMYQYSDHAPTTDRVTSWAAQAPYYPAPSTGLSASSHYADSALCSGISHQGYDPSEVYHPLNHQYQDSTATATYAPTTSTYTTQVTYTTWGSGSDTLVGSAYQVQGKKGGGFKAFFGGRKPITTTWYSQGHQQHSQPQVQVPRQPAKLQKKRPTTQTQGQKRKSFLGFVIGRDYTEPLIGRA